MARERGKDNIFTEKDLCLVIHRAERTAYVVGGRGQAEKVVDMLGKDECLKFTWRGDEQYFKPLLYRSSRRLSAGISSDNKMVDSVVIMFNESKFDIRFVKPGVQGVEKRIPTTGKEEAFRDLPTGVSVKEYLKKRYNGQVDAWPVE
jgi:hypothetical protein